MKKIYLIILLVFLSSCSEDKKNKNENDLVKITFATDWKAQAEQGGFYQALASGIYLEKGLDNFKISVHLPVCYLSSIFCNLPLSCR